MVREVKKNWCALPFGLAFPLVFGGTLDGLVQSNHLGALSRSLRSQFQMIFSWSIAFWWSASEGRGLEMSRDACGTDHQRVPPHACASSFTLNNLMGMLRFAMRFIIAKKGATALGAIAGGCPTTMILNIFAFIPRPREHY